MDTPVALSEQEQIAILAHRIYEEEGRPEGRAAEHWARAERAIHEQRVGTVKAKIKTVPGKTPKRPASATAKSKRKG